MDTDGDIWIGAGFAIKATPLKHLLLEMSFMPGYYHAGSGGTPLGYPLEFRSLIGVGYRFDNGSALSLALDHKSNNGFGATNPGSETISLRYRRSF